MSRWRSFGILTGVLLASTGCLSPLLMAPSSTPLDGRAYEVTGAAIGESCSDSVLGIPISRDASLYTALETARVGAGAEALVDVVVDRWTLATLFYNKSCTVVHARGIRFTSLIVPAPSTPGPAPAAPQSAPALPATPAAPATPGETAKAAPPAAGVVPAAPALSAAASTQPAEKKPALTRAQLEAERKAKAAEEKRKAAEEKVRLAEEKKRAEEERRLAAVEKKRAEEEARKKEEEEKKKAEADKAKAEEDAKRKVEAEARKKTEEEEHKPVPEEFWPYCKFQAGDPIRVETKNEVIEAEFVECVHFGIRAKAKGQDPGVIPFEQIWSVVKAVPAATPAPQAPPAGPAVPSGPAKPAQPAKPGTH